MLRGFSVYPRGFRGFSKSEPPFFRIIPESVTHRGVVRKLLHPTSTLKSRIQVIFSQNRCFC
ncbi:MAG: hypothetical protein P8X74_14660 [Reinekea sp.]